VKVTLAIPAASSRCMMLENTWPVKVFVTCTTFVLEWEITFDSGMSLRFYLKPVLDSCVEVVASV